MMHSTKLVDKAFIFSVLYIRLTYELQKTSKLDHNDDG